MNMNEAIRFYEDQSAKGSKQIWRQSAPLIAGSALAVFGISRRSNAGLALAAAGGAIAYFGTRAASSDATDESLARGSVLVNCSAQDAYRRYRNLEDLPKFMHHLKSVTKIGEGQYRWVALGPLGTSIQWDSEIIEDREGEFISWRSLPGSELTAAGAVRFQTAPTGRGTTITATTHFDHPAGKLGAAVAKLFGKDPSFLMQQDLRRLKALIEAGEIPTIAGQTHGPRSAKATMLESLDPDRSQKRNAPVSEIFEQRRTA
jgi:uncharacterized membrane protein